MLARLLVLGLCCLTASSLWAADPTEQKISVKVDLLYRRVDQPNAIEIHSKVSGNIKEPLGMVLDGTEGVVCELRVKLVPESEPRQYQAQVVISEVNAAGEEIEITTPRLLLAAGKTGRIQVGVDPAPLVDCAIFISEK